MTMTVRSNQGAMERPTGPRDLPCTTNGMTGTGGSTCRPAPGPPSETQSRPRSLVRVSRVIFMCGPAGSGKSTVARTFEQQGMVRLSFDQEAWDRGFRTMPLPDGAHRQIEAILRERLVTLVRQGTDVVLDFSFWSRRSREDYRDLLRPLGIEPETVYLATDRDTALQRVRSRAAKDGDDFRLPDEVAARYFDHFEAPTPEEGPLVVMPPGEQHAARERRQLTAIQEFVDIAADLDIRVWLRGGWALDFTVGRVTREHEDIDWFALAEGRRPLTEALLDRGFRHAGTAPEDQQTDLALGDVEHGIAWIRIEDGAAVVAGGPWAGAPWVAGMLDGPDRELHGTRAPVITAQAQAEIKALTPQWQPHLPRRDKDRLDLDLLRRFLDRPDQTSG